MAIFEIHENELKAVDPTTFGAEGLYERRHIQRLLKANIGVLDDRLMVIAEEFGDWLDSSRRIDLLCVDKDANLVVVELKRTEDGGHMELQALRYAAMVSAMTFDQLVEAHARALNKELPDLESARSAILGFLAQDEFSEDEFGRDTRVRFLVEGGYRSPTEDWPRIFTELTDAMMRLDRAMRARIEAIRFVAPT